MQRIKLKLHNYESLFVWHGLFLKSDFVNIQIQIKSARNDCN